MKDILQTFDQFSTIQKILTTVIVTVILYGSSSSVSFALFSNLSRQNGTKLELVSALPGPANAVIEDPNEPKTETCPLNGSLHSKRAKDNWEKRRPLAVMIENHQEARPQSGLSAADLVYEAVAEGGITRFMAIFYCNLSDVQVGPVRSARTYFLDWLGEYDALYAHVGGANTPGPADALSQIIRYKVKDLNQFSIGFPVFWRDYQRLGHPVATEHTMYSTTQKLWEIGAKRNWAVNDEDGIRWDKNFTPWKFGTSTVAAGQTGNITVNFWENQPSYQVEWIYEASTKSYKRKNVGAIHEDLNNHQPIEAKNIVVQLTRESNANDGYENNVHLLYKTTGSGKALIFQNGQVIEGKWIKDSRISRSKYVTASGKEIEFTPGPIWIETVPEGAKITY